MTKRWFISGASRGIGFCLTEQLLSQGHYVYAVSRSIESEGISRLQSAYPDHLRVATLNVCSLEDIHRVSQACLTAWGSIDVLVNNAGYGLFGAVEECSDEEIMQVMKTNVHGSWRLMHAFLPSMRSARSGHIIQLSSVAGQTATPGFGIYNMSKWAVEGLCDALSQEVSAFGIHVTLIEPGPVATDFFSVGKSAAAARPIEAYRSSSDVARIFQYVQNRAQAIAEGSAGDTPMSDPEKVARAIIEVSTAKTPPLRLALGSTAYLSIQARLKERLANLEHYKSVSFSTDKDSATV